MQPIDHYRHVPQNLNRPARCGLGRVPDAKKAYPKPDVPKAGLEPACLATHASETCVSTNFTTSALEMNDGPFSMVPRTGFEPAHLNGTTPSK